MYMIMQQTILSSEEPDTRILMIVCGALIASFVSVCLCMFLWEQSGICKTFVHSMMMMVSIFVAHSFVYCSVCWAERAVFKEKLNGESYEQKRYIYIYIYIYIYTVYSESERHSKKNRPKLQLDILVQIASVDVSVALSLLSLIWVLPASCSFFSLGSWGYISDSIRSTVCACVCVCVCVCACEGLC